MGKGYVLTIFPSFVKRKKKKKKMTLDLLSHRVLSGSHLVGYRLEKVMEQPLTITFFFFVISLCLFGVVTHHTYLKNE